MDPQAALAKPGMSAPYIGVNICAWRPTSMTSNIPTTINAFIGVHNTADLKGNRVRIHRSIEIVTSIHEDNTCDTYITNDRNRQISSYLIRPYNRIYLKKASERWTKLLRKNRFTCKPISTKSKMHVNKYNVSEIAKIMNKHPVETLRNVDRENVIKLAVLPRKPSKNVIG